MIELSQKWSQMLFIISNSKLGIWIYSQPVIYLKSQSIVFYVLILYHTSLCPELFLLWIFSNIQTIYSEHIIYLVHLKLMLHYIYQVNPVLYYFFIMVLASLFQARPNQNLDILSPLQNHIRVPFHLHCHNHLQIFRLGWTYWKY